MNTEQKLTLETLPPEVRDIIKIRAVKGKKRPAQWVSLLKPISQFGEDVDKSFNKAKGIAILFGIISGFLMFTGLAFKGNVVYIFLAIGGILAFPAIIFGIKALSLGKIRIDNELRKKLLPVLEMLEMLAEDIPEKGKIDLYLDLEDPSHGKNVISDKELPPGSNSRLIERKYESHCCKASIPLLDGSQLTLDIIKQATSYYREYRSSSGKPKHKQKWKMITMVTTAIVPNREKFTIDEAEVSKFSQNNKIKLAGKKGAQQCKLTRKFKFKSNKEIRGECVSPETIIDMFMQVCSMLNRAA